MTRDELLNLLHTENLLKFSEAAMSLYAENERLRAERDALRSAIVEAHATVMETYTEDEGTPLHEDLLEFFTSILHKVPARDTPAGEGRDG